MSVKIVPKVKPWEKPLDKDLAVRPDPKTALAKEDPIAHIRQGMLDRGFETLWTTYPGSRIPRHGFTDATKITFLRHYSVTGRMAYSAAASGISRFTVNAYCRGDPVFNEAVEEARAYFRDLLAGELYRRGVEGFEEEVLGGKNRDKIIKIRKYSDRALELLSKVHMKELQKQDRQDPKTADQPTTIVNNQFNFNQLNPEDLAMAKKLLENQTKTIEGEVVDESDGK